MTVRCTPTCLFSVEETIVQDALSGAVVKHTGFNQSALALSASSTPPFTMTSFVTYTLVAGAKTIDLSALAGLLGTQNATGLKVQGAIVVNPAANATMTIKPGAVNPYNLNGGNWLVLTAHATAVSWVAFLLPEGLPDVAAGAKNIDISGTGTQTIKIGLLLG